MTLAKMIAKKRTEYFRALVGGTRREAKDRQRELVLLMARKIAAEDKMDRKLQRAA